MDGAVRQHIFDPFFTTKEANKGTGLGLSVVYGILKNHGGTITCESEPGRGTTFSVYLPACREPEAGKVEIRQDPARSTSPATLLMVDDNANLLEIGRDMLCAHGYEVMTAESGEEALRMFRVEKDRIDLVLLDMIMPGMGGAKCLDELLRLKPGAKVLISSGCIPDEAMTETVLNRASGYVGKPYRYDELCREIDRVLQPEGRETA
jgi:CheY-like chemotaxis protein